MATIGVRELKSRTSDIIQRSERGETFVVTKRGRPISVLMPLDDDDLEDFVLANAPRFTRLYERGLREYREGETVDLEVLKRRLGRPTSRTRVGLARRTR